MKRCGIKYCFERVIPEKETLLRFLEGTSSISVCMASDFLTYNSVFAQTGGASHFINILDYNSKSKKFYIVDGDVPSAKTGYYSGWIDEVDVLNGWGRMHGIILRIILPEGRDWKTLFHEVRMKANEQVEKAIKKYIDGKNKFYSSKVTGKEAIRCMVRELETYVGSFDFKQITRNVNFSVRVNGFISSKLFLLEKLRQQKIGSFREYEQVIQKWSQWCILLLKSGLIGRKDYFMYVKERMEMLVDHEQIILEGILKEWEKVY